MPKPSKLSRQIDPSEYVGQGEAARLTDHAVQRIPQLRREGRLHPIKTAIGYLYARSELLEYRRARDRRRAINAIRRGNTDGA